MADFDDRIFISDETNSAFKIRNISVWESNPLQPNQVKYYLYIRALNDK
jgi:hypothetical protein